MNDKLIKEADVLLHSLDCGVIDTNALRSFLKKVVKNGSAAINVPVKDRVKHYLTKLSKTPQRKAV